MHDLVQGSRVISSDIGGAIRSWLVFTTAGSRLPVVLNLSDEPYADHVTRVDAGHASSQQARVLLGKLRALDDDQMTALLQQEGGSYSGTALVDRILKFWGLPRLEAIDWLHSRRGTDTVTVPKWIQDHEWTIAAYDPVMLAGDGFPDLHGTVTEDRSDAWVVRIEWDTDRLDRNIAAAEHGGNAE